MAEPWGYLLSYFKSRDEALHLAVSRGGAIFSPINGGRPTLRGAVGTGTLRDPFIGVGPDGYFHLLATDGWTSTSIVHATSRDLASWSEQRLLPVMRSVHGALNAWAPEFFFDPMSGHYHLLWSSVVDGSGRLPPNWPHEGQDQRIWHATTEDFYSFSAPALFFDPGHPVIDATVHRAGDRFLMAYKDERGHNDLRPEHKRVLLTSFRRPGGPFSAPVGPISPAPTEGPTLFRQGNRWVVLFDYYLDDFYGAAASEDGRDWHPVDTRVPAGARHASVLTLSHGTARRVAWDSFEFDVESVSDEGRAQSNQREEGLK